jgi:hypothetical protein
MRQTVARRRGAPPEASIPRPARPGDPQNIPAPQRLPAHGRAGRNPPRLSRDLRDSAIGHGRTNQQVIEFVRLFVGEWCNGSTTDSDSVCLGSNPSSPATAGKQLTIRPSEVALSLSGAAKSRCDRSRRRSSCLEKSSLLRPGALRRDSAPTCDSAQVARRCSRRPTKPPRVR